MTTEALEYDALTYSSPHPFKNPSPLNGGIGRTRVALVGFEEQTKRTAPYDDPLWDIWTFNMANRLGIMHDREGRFRADRWFDLHEEHAQDLKDMSWIMYCPVPIYLTETIGDNPNARVYNIESIMERIVTLYGRAPVITYFASSFAYALALAIAEGYTTIGLFGISLDWGRERIVERGNLEYWIGFAQGLGIAIQLGDGCKLLTHPGLYGFEYDKEKDGVLDLCAEVMRQLLQSSAMKDRLDANLKARMDELINLAQEANLCIQRLVSQSIKDMPRD